MGEALLDHLERHLGPMERALERPDTPAPAVLVFPGRPRAGATTCVTFGLSTHDLAGYDDVPTVRQELLMCGWDRWTEAMELLLESVVDLLLEHHWPIPAAAMHTFESPPPGATADAVISWPPVVLPAGLDPYADPAGEQVELRWLVPLVGPEWHALREADDETRLAAVEALLAGPGVDLLDLARAPAGDP